MHRFSLYYNTARFLRCGQAAEQILGRFRNSRVNLSAFASRPLSSFPGTQWDRALRFPAFSRPSGVYEPDGRFIFLNRAEQLNWPPRWDSPDLPKLWLYNLHYFDWIWELEFEKARSVVEDWIGSHRPGRNRVGWEPYPTSLRLMNWTAYFFGQNREYVEADQPFTRQLWQSLCLQANWLQGRIEYHLLANHLLENAAALAFAGSCFQGSDARKWFKTGSELLLLELKEQIPADGLHYERSPMYHCRILHVLALLAATGDPRLSDLVMKPLRRMASALLHVIHPDGRIALLNDSAFGIYHEPHELLSYLTELDPDSAIPSEPEYGPFSLKDAGYYGWRSADGHYLICNAGNIRPDYQPGHTHADIFSFELSYGGCRVIVDSGVSTYEPGKERDYCRSTRAHNTVEIAGQDQSEMWGSFRVARRARVQVLDYTQSDRGFSLSAVHDGYERLRRGLRHTRRFVWRSDGYLEVTDSIASNPPAGTVSRLHLSPECTVDQVTGGKALLSLNDMKFSVSFSGNGSLRVEDSFYCPEFGRKIQNKQLAYYPEPGEKEWRLAILILGA